MPNYPTKPDSKGATGVDKSNLTPKLDLARLKDEVDEMNIGTLKTVHVDLRKLY